MDFQQSKDRLDWLRHLKEIPMLPAYEKAQKFKGEDNDIHVQVREMSRSSTWNSESPALSRTSTWKKLDDVDVQIRELSRSSTMRTEFPETVTRAKRSSQSWAWAIISQIIGLLWLAPIITLLVLNYTKYVIGASIWCPMRKCSADFLSGLASQAISKAQQLDGKDHDVMGALQFVSKALEVWFMFISTSLVYDVAMLFAKRGGGLPVGFLLTHLEFGDIRYIFNPLLWTSPIPYPNCSPRAYSTAAKLYLFVALAASLTILTNLMGPATAVLAIPTLQWVDTTHRPAVIFNQSMVRTGPLYGDVLPNCNDEEIKNFSFSCTMKAFGSGMDYYAKSLEIMAEERKMSYDGSTLPILSQEGLLQYRLNSSEDGNITWVPNRQVLRDFSDDVMALRSSVLNVRDKHSSNVDDDPDGWRYNNSLQTILQREGLSFGSTGSCFLGDKQPIYLSDDMNKDDRMVICYTNWSPGSWTQETYTKCIKSGFDWDESNDETLLYLGDADPQKGQAMISYYSSTHSIIFNESSDFGKHVQSCLDRFSPASCDWAEIFATPPPPEFESRTKNVFISEYALGKIGRVNQRVWCDSQVYLSYPTYSYDASPLSNPVSLVQMNKLPVLSSSLEPEILSVAWLLAAWSTDDHGRIAGTRPIAQQFLKILPLHFGIQPDTSVTLADLRDKSFQTEFDLLHAYTMSQALSHINYYFGYANNATQLANVHGRMFHRYATIHVWAYGLSDQTSMLGVVVAILGIFCVIVRFVLAVFYKFRHEHSSVELLVAALNHKSQGEFDGLENEKDLAKVRYEMTEDEEGKPIFMPESRQNSWPSPQQGGGPWGWEFRR